MKEYHSLEEYSSSGVKEEFISSPSHDNLQVSKRSILRQRIIHIQVSKRSTLLHGVFIFRYPGGVFLIARVFI
jgi:hypothetical protein